jgi:subtilisin family serine protease
MDIVERDFTGEGNGDGHGHGTHVAGTIFGQPVNGFRFGVAPGIQRALVGKVLDSNGTGSTEGIVKAMQWAFDEGATILSMSLGMSFPRFIQRLIDQEGWPEDLASDVGLQGYRANLRIFDRLVSLLQGSDNTPFFRDLSRGALVVAAAGNESRRQINPDYELAVAPPAAANGAISVGALGQANDGTLSVANFSNTGCNIAAPGVSVVSSIPGGGFSAFNGTSMAAPHVAGVAALWAEKLLTEKGWINTRQLASLILGRAAIIRRRH